MEMVKAAAVGAVDVTESESFSVEASPWDAFDTEQKEGEGTGAEMEAVEALADGELRVVSDDTPEAESVTEIHVEIDGDIEKIGDAVSVEIDATVEVETTDESQPADNSDAEDEGSYDECDDCDCDDSEVADDDEADEDEDESDEPTAEESAYMRKLREAEQEYADACLELAELDDKLATTKEEIKDQREVCKALAGKLRTIKKQGEAQLDIDDMPLVSGKKKKTKKHDDDATDSSGTEAADATDDGGTPRRGKPAGHAANGEKSGASSGCAVGCGPDDWKRVPIEQLGLDQIKGMGKKKLEAIYDECQTLGELESLRAGAGLMSIKGVGRGMADQIEEVILTWLSRNRDSEVLAAAAGGAIEEQDHCKQIMERVAELRKLTSFETKPGFEGAFESGVQAYNETEGDITDCPWTPCENQDAWLMGWLHAESLDKGEFVDTHDSPSTSSD
jgi:hypothetical protein